MFYYGWEHLFFQIPRYIEKGYSTGSFINLIIDITNSIFIFDFKSCLFGMIESAESLEYEIHYMKSS